MPRPRPYPTGSGPAVAPAEPPDPVEDGHAPVLVLVHLQPSPARSGTDAAATESTRSCRCPPCAPPSGRERWPASPSSRAPEARARCPALPTPRERRVEMWARSVSGTRSPHPSPRSPPAPAPTAAALAASRTAARSGPGPVARYAAVISIPSSAIARPNRVGLSLSTFPPASGVCQQCEPRSVYRLSNSPFAYTVSRTPRKLDHVPSSSTKNPEHTSPAPSSIVTTRSHHSPGTHSCVERPGAAASPPPTSAPGAGPRLRPCFTSPVDLIVEVPHGPDLMAAPAQLPPPPEVPRGKIRGPLTPLAGARRPG